MTYELDKPGWGYFVGIKRSFTGSAFGFTLCWVPSSDSTPQTLRRDVIEDKLYIVWYVNKFFPNWGVVTVNKVSSIEITALCQRRSYPLNLSQAKRNRTIYYLNKEFKK